MKYTDCREQVTNSYVENNDKYCSNVTVNQLRDGLDVFYEDFKNRKITIGPASWIVLQKIAGTPADDMEKIIENYRRNGE